MPLAVMDPVDIVFGLFFPPIGALVVYGGAYAMARTVSGRPLSPSAKQIYRYIAIFTVGMGYIMTIIRFTLGSDDQLLWASVAAWGILVACFGWWRHKRKENSENSTRLAEPQ